MKRTSRQQLTIAEGSEVYCCDQAHVIARGATFRPAELDHAIEHRLAGILGDSQGRRNLGQLLGGLATTQFATNQLNKILQAPIVVDDWRVGEAIAEAFLVDHRQCFFPWPGTRDQKNANSSPAGADLVGFVGASPNIKFAFGEVKTSAEANWPPGVVTSRHGLIRQVEALLSDSEEKRQLVRYLGHHATDANWKSAFQEAAAAYLNCPFDISVFGFLIRDVAAKEEDLKNRTAAIAASCPTETMLEFRAKYLPIGRIASLATDVQAKMGAVK